MPVKTKDQLKAELNMTFFENTGGGITPSLVQTFMIDVIDSIPDAAGPNYAFGTGTAVGSGSAIGITRTPPAFTTDFLTLSSLPTGVSFSRATIGTRFNSSGVNVTEAIDAPRFDHAWNGSAWVATGLLNERQRTNLHKSSGDLTTTDWIVFGGSRALSSTLSPDGVSFMTEFTAASGSHAASSIYHTVLTYTANTVVTISRYFKKSNYNYAAISFQSDTANAWVTAIFDLSTGLMTQSAQGSGSGTLVSAALQDVGGGIYRATLTASHAGSTAYGMTAFAQAATGNTFDAAGDVALTGMAGTEKLLVWGAQFEAGSFATSYIPTTTAAVTRSVDVPGSSSPLTGYLAAGPSVWEFQDEATGTIARSAYAAGAFDWPVDKWYRSMGVYPSGTDTSGHMTVGSPY